MVSLFRSLFLISKDLKSIFFKVNCIQNWNYKYSQTGTNNQQLTLNCINNEQIWIGWSHYGTRQSNLDSILVNIKQIEKQNDFLTINTYVLPSLIFT